MAAEVHTRRFDIPGAENRSSARTALNSPTHHMRDHCSGDPCSSRELPNSEPSLPREIAVTLLTGGFDKHYVFGLTTELDSKGVALDVIGSDQLDCPEFHDKLGLNFLNLRGDQRPDASCLRKMSRVLRHYCMLICYAATAKPRIFHIIWNNRFETFDRTLLMLYYRFLGKRVVFTAHNVNAGRRDAKDTFFNRLTLRIQYRLADHIFVHTEKMKREIIELFGAQEPRITVIPYGINNAVPITSLTPSEAKRRLGIRNSERTILFFGWITPYKGLEYLLTAFRHIVAPGGDYRLIIAGRPDKDEKYWNTIKEAFRQELQDARVLLRSEFIPDDQIEVYFKAADVLVLPYKHIYQSGILFLAQSFGLPALAADVGSLKDDVVEGKTGFIFRPEDPIDLARAIEQYFNSDLFADLNDRRQEIQQFAAERHSWGVVGPMTIRVYADLLRRNAPRSLGRKRPSVV
jgi:D-inositol-3-phosphate glycosyltransferase